MPSHPRVSVVMPCFNSERFVAFAIDSILAQTMPDFEFIIVNDGSTDGTAGAVKRFADPRIRFIDRRENLGNYVSRNEGMRLCRGKYIAVMDADDIAYPNRLEVQCNYLDKRPKVGAIGSQGVFMDENGRPSGKICKPLVPHRKLRALLLMDNCVTHPSFMIRRHLVLRHGLFYRENYRYAADYELMARCAALFRMENIPDLLIRYRQYPDQISSRHRQGQMEIADQVRAGQLNAIGFVLTDEQLAVYLAMMKRQRLDNLRDCQAALGALNSLLEQNRAKRVFGQGFLYEFFHHLLAGSCYG